MPAAIEVGATYKNAAGKVVHADRYNLLSPEVTDSSKNAFNFLDQQRVQLPNGEYTLELTVLDKNRGTKPATINNTIKLEYYENIIAISDIQLVDQFTPSTATSMITKSGYDVVPFADNFYPPSIEKIRFYAEVYNTNKVIGENPYLLSFHIESEESKRKLDNLSGFVRQQAAAVNVMMREISIKDLPSGNYNLILEARNSQNEILRDRRLRHAL